MRQVNRSVRALSFGVSLLVIGAAPALAQAPSDAPQSASPAPAAEAGSAGQGGDIIVTAQRRTERLRDVPISITALNAETLTKSGITSTIDLPKVAVGVELPLYGGFVRPSIRGVSSGLSSLGDSSNVALYIDGVYQPSESGQLADMPDVQSVQILKGPQGSLYGQNAAGGAIIIDTVTPSFKLKGVLSASYGNYNDMAFRGYVTGPIAPTVAVALSGSYEDHGGFNKDLLRGGHDTGLHSQQIRGKILWQPSPSTSFTLAAYYTNRKDSGIYTGAPYRGNSAGNATILEYPAFYGSYPAASKPHTFAENFIPTTNIKGWGVSLVGKIGLGDIGTLNTISAYQQNKVYDQTDIDESAINIGSSKPLPITSHAFIQELNFVSSKFGRFSFTAGLFFMARQEQYHGQLFNLYFGGLPYPANPQPDLQIGTYSKNKKQSYAAYVEGNYDITDTVTLTVAGRYSYEKQKAFNSEYPDKSMYGDPRGYFSFKKFTPRAVLRWKPDNNNTIYASYSQGFKSGLVDNGNIMSCYDPVAGHAFQCLPLRKPIQPETVEAYEIGYKARVSNSLNFSVAVFHYLYKNIQVFIYDPVKGTGGAENAGAGKIDGFEFEGNYKATRDLTLNLGVSYLKTKYTDYKLASVYVPATEAECNSKAHGYVHAPCGNDQVSLPNAKGKRLIHAPDWTINGSIDYDHEFAAGRLGVNVSANYDGGFFFDANNRIKQKPYALLNAELSFEPAGVQGLRLVLWGKNLTNHNYLQSVLETNFADAVSWAPPRQFGGRVEFRF